MIAVAVVAAGLFVARLIQLRAYYQSIALNHRREEATFVRWAHGFDAHADGMTRDFIGRPDSPPGFWEKHVSNSRAAASASRARAAHESRLGAKYEFAARYPWLPVLPDPPDPN